MGLTKATDRGGTGGIFCCSKHKKQAGFALYTQIWLMAISSDKGEQGMRAAPFLAQTKHCCGRLCVPRIVLSICFCSLEKSS